MLPPIGLQYIKAYKDAIKVRENLSKYFVNDGAVDFQWNKIKY